MWRKPLLGIASLLALANISNSFADTSGTVDFSGDIAASCELIVSTPTGTISGDAGSANLNGTGAFVNVKSNSSVQIDHSVQSNTAPDGANATFESYVGDGEEITILPANPGGEEVNVGVSVTTTNDLFSSGTYTATVLVTCIPIEDTDL